MIIFLFKLHFNFLFKLHFIHFKIFCILFVTFSYEHKSIKLNILSFLIYYKFNSG